MFFGELGFSFPQFPFIAHSRGWSAEDMENNVAEVRTSAELRQGAHGLVDRCLELAGRLVAVDAAPAAGSREAAARLMTLIPNPCSNFAQLSPCAFRCGRRRMAFRLLLTQSFKAALER